MFCINCAVAREYGTDYLAWFLLLARCIVDYICFVDVRITIDVKARKKKGHIIDMNAMLQSSIYSRALCFSCTATEIFVFLSRVLPRECKNV